MSDDQALREAIFRAEDALRVRAIPITAENLANWVSGWPRATVREAIEELAMAGRLQLEERAAIVGKMLLSSYPVDDGERV